MDNEGVVRLQKILEFNRMKKLLVSAQVMISGEGPTLATATSLSTLTTKSALGTNNSFINNNSQEIPKIETPSTANIELDINWAVKYVIETLKENTYLYCTDEGIRLANGNERWTLCKSGGEGVKEASNFERLDAFVGLTKKTMGDDGLESVKEEDTAEVVHVGTESLNSKKSHQTQQLSNSKKDIKEAIELKTSVHLGMPSNTKKDANTKKSTHSNSLKDATAKMGELDLKSSKEETTKVDNSIIPSINVKDEEDELFQFDESETWANHEEESDVVEVEAEEQHFVLDSEFEGFHTNLTNT